MVLICVFSEKKSYFNYELMFTQLKKNKTARQCCSGIVLVKPNSRLVIKIVFISLKIAISATACIEFVS